MTAANLGALPPKWARFCLGVESFLLEELGFSPRGYAFVLAFSGGLDSTALAHILRILSPRLGTSLTAAHLDHGLREESAREAAVVQAACGELGIDCATQRRDAAAAARKSGQGVEAAARSVRYAFLEEVRAAHAPAIVVTAHQQNDLAEDVLMRLSRGTGWPGLGGMPAWDPARHLLRPLLMTPRSVLKAFLDDMGVSYLTDPSNADRRFTRNRIRESILPLFLEENPNFLETAGRLWRQAAMDEAWFSRELGAYPGPDGAARVLLEERRLRALSPALRLRLFKKILDGLGPGESLAKTLLALETAFAGKRRGTVFQFPGKKTASVTREGVAFQRE